MAQIDFLHLIADGVDRIERGHGILKDHAQTIPAQFRHLIIRQREQIAPFKGEALRCQGGIARQKTHQGQ